MTFAATQNVLAVVVGRDPVALTVGIWTGFYTHGRVAVDCQDVVPIETGPTRFDFGRLRHFSLLKSGLRSMKARGSSLQP